MKQILKFVLSKLGLLDIARQSYHLLMCHRSRLAHQVSALIWYGGIKKLPVPPSDLIVLVAGTPDVIWFLEGGRLGAKTAFDILRRNGIEMNSLGSILDFGCGCGRVMRYMSILEKQKLFGTDYNPDLVLWCQKNLPFASFAINQLEPSLVYEENTLDLIYVFSVFTHLPEALQKSWMCELRRILKPGGYLILSTHGGYYLDRLSAEERVAFLSGHLVVHDAHLAGTNVCTAFHPFQYVRNELADGFNLVDFAEKGAKGNPYQDVFLLQKSTV